MQVTLDARADLVFVFFFSSRRRHTRLQGDWSSDVCSSDLIIHRVEDVTEFIRLKQEGSEQHRVTEELRARAAKMEADIFRKAQQIQITERLRARAAEMEAEIFRRAQLIQEVNNQLRTELEARKRAEEALQKSEERFRAVAETATDAIVSADSRGHITYFNPGAELIFGHAARDVIGKPLTWLMPDRFHDAHRQGIARFLSTGKAHVIGRTVELVGRRKDGTEFPLELSLASWKVGGDTFFTRILRDITERKRAEELLRASEERFHLMVTHVEDYAIFMLDVEGNVATWNAGAERIKGYRADAIRSEEHTSELQSPCNLVCRLLLEKKKNDMFISRRGEN